MRRSFIHPKFIKSGETAEEAHKRRSQEGKIAAQMERGIEAAGHYPYYTNYVDKKKHRSKDKEEE